MSSQILRSRFTISNFATKSSTSQKSVKIFKTKTDVMGFIVFPLRELTNKSGLEKCQLLSYPVFLKLKNDLASGGQIKAKNVGCFIQYFYPIFFNMLAVNKRFVYNKKIKSCAGAHWDAYTWAASHSSPRVCAPYLKVMLLG